MAIVKKVRRCGECNRTFVNPESFRMHKLRGIGCRSEEALRARGYIETPKGWKHIRKEGV